MKVKDLRLDKTYHFKDIKQGEGFALTGVPGAVLIKICCTKCCKTADGLQFNAIDPSANKMYVSELETVIPLELEMTVKKPGQFEK